MPEINPLTNDQIFLKKIAENTGSDYETGDVSEINPLTIDQIFLKEIAANTDGQSGDISELEDKVAYNTAAIEAITEVYGAKNVCPFPSLSELKAINISGTWNNNVYSYHGATFTVDETTKTISIEKQTLSEFYPVFYLANNIDFGDTLISTISSEPQTANGLTISDGNDIATKTVNYGVTYGASDHTVYAFVDYNQTLSSAVTIKPMIRDARITDPTYVPYAMTNRELTERVKVTKGTYTSDSSMATISVTKLDGYYLAGVTCNHVGGYLCSFSAHSSTDYYVIIMDYDTTNNTITFKKNFETELLLTWIKE